MFCSDGWWLATDDLEQPTGSNSGIKQSLIPEDTA
jgi:hypothetical protein